MSETMVSREMLTMVDAIANERRVEKEVIFEALERAFAQSIKKILRTDAEVEVHIDRQKGSHQVWLVKEVVPDGALEDPARQAEESEAHKHDPGLKAGDLQKEPVHVPLSRIGAQAFKQTLMQKVREAERQQILNDFLYRRSKLVSGVVKRVERIGVIVEAGRVEGMLRRENMIPRENLRLGDRVRAVIIKVDPSSRGPQLVLSRIDPQLMIELFALEVPEIEEGLLEIKGCARDPGVRAKIAVKSNTSRLDPIGTCVGLRGMRVQAVSRELCEERIDIVIWSEDPVQFVINALSPAEVESIYIDEEKHTMDVVVPSEGLAQAIGKNGQNVRLASQLTGWNLNVLTAEEAEKKREGEARAIFHLFVEKLGAAPEVAESLVNEGFTSLEEIAYVDKEELLAAGITDEALIDNLRARAKAILAEYGAEKPASLLSIQGMTEEVASLLAEKGIISRESLADLSAGELAEITGMDPKEASHWVLAAREPLFASVKS